jgi:RNA polymerase sporulation-specific sigma factor
LTDQSTIELIHRIKGGDEQAFALLLSRFEPLILSTVARFCKPPAYRKDDFEDLKQEAVLALFKAAESFDEDFTRVSFGLYAKICIKNRLISAKRQRMRALKKDGRGVGRPRKQREGHPASCSKKSAPPDEERLRSLLEQSKDRLTSREQQAFDLYLQGRSYKEIGEELHCTVKSVDNALARAKRKIKERLPRD